VPFPLHGFSRGCASALRARPGASPGIRGLTAVRKASRSNMKTYRHLHHSAEVVYRIL
jgi:hypothetical protein